MIDTKYISEMNKSAKNIKKYVLVYILFISAFSLIVIPDLALKIVGNDVYYHLIMAREVILEKTPIPNHPPVDLPFQLKPWYPPFFHWLLAMLSLFNQGNLEDVVKILQLVLFPISLYVTYLLYSSIADKESAFLGVVLLSITFPFFTRMHQAFPEAIEHILLPLTLLAYLKGREKLCAVLLLIQFLNHLLTPFLVLAMIVFHSLYNRRIPLSWTGALIISPGIILQLIYIPRFLHISGIYYSYGVSSPDRAYLNAVLSIIVLLLFGILGLWRNRERINIAHIWLLCLLPVFIHLPSRFVAYVSLPLAILAAMYIRRLFEIKLLNRYLTCFLLFTVIIFLMLSSPVFYRYSGDLVFELHPNDVEAEAMEWIKENMARNEVVTVVHYHEGYRIFYYTERRTSNKMFNYNKSRYLFYRSINGNQLQYLLYNRSGCPSCSNWSQKKVWSQHIEG